MRDIWASVEIRALIGAEKLRVLACRVFRVVKLAHAACADPQIIEVDAVGMRTVAAQTAVRNIASERGKQDGSFAEAKPARQGGARHEDNVARSKARPGW
jgi:hypothetical protein